MTLQESVLPDFDHETSVARRLVERVPAADTAWQPHDRSFTMGQLAMHLALLVGWGRTILNDDYYDVAGGPGDRPGSAATPVEILRAFDDTVAAVRKDLTSKSDAELLSVWELRNGGEPMMSMPRITAFRSFVIHHLIHHRGQLSVYLRLRDVPVPPMYGPSADEGM